MKAVQFDRVGEPSDVLAVRDVDIPTARPDEVIVEVGLSPVHPADLLFIRGAYRIAPSFPQTAGLEGMGQITAGRANLLTGTRVAFRWPGAWAKYVSVPADRVTPVPTSVSEETAAQFELNVLTALAILEKIDAAGNEAIVITAATSVVGNLLAQFGRMRGLTTIGIVRGAVSSGASRTSCDYVVSMNDVDFVDRVRHLAPGGVAALLDAVGGQLAIDLLPVLRPCASVVSYGVLAKEPIIVHSSTFIYKNLHWLGFGIEQWERGLTRERKAVLLAYAADAISRGEVRLPTPHVFRLDDVLRGIKYNDESGRVGKILLKP